MEKEQINKQNEILLKAKESIYKFQKQFNNILQIKNDENTNSPIKNKIDDNNISFKQLTNFNDTNNNDIKNKNIDDKKIYSLTQNYDKNSIDEEKHDSDNDNDNNNLQKYNLYNNKREKIYNNIIDENYVLKSEINRLIDENKKLNNKLNDSKNIMNNKEIELVINKNKELSKLVKELNNKNRIQRQRIQDNEQQLKEKNNYISQIELKIKEIKLSKNFNY